MAEQTGGTHWTEVDGTAEPTHYVDYLDTATALGVIQAYKLASYRWLDVQEGHHILDVGCGTGDDVVALARIVGETGRVMGIDSSETMIAEARQRAEGFDLPVEFSVGDAHDLEFTDNTFDGCRADRVFQHLPDREGALAEMIRVARPGARIVVLDPDWGTAVVDSPDRELTRKVVGRMCDRRRNGWCGRQLHRFFKRAGLLDVFVYPWTLVITDLALTDQLGRLRTTVQELHEAGEVTAAEANGWLEHLQQASQAGLFFSALTGFAACGRKPWELTT